LRRRTFKVVHAPRSERACIECLVVSGGREAAARARRFGGVESKRSSDGVNVVAKLLETRGETRRVRKELAGRAVARRGFALPAICITLASLSESSDREAN
jgi:hypothetical protein